MNDQSSGLADGGQTVGAFLQIPKVICGGGVIFLSMKLYHKDPNVLTKNKTKKKEKKKININQTPKK